MLTHARLKEVLNYDPRTGIFTWASKFCKKVVVGSVAGVVRPDGRRVISVDGKAYRAHRLAWFYVHGSMPELEIDHKNGKTDDNRLKNLRLATGAQNKQNVHASRRHNKAGLLGVQKANAKFKARIVLDGKQHYLGVFDTPELAHKAYLKAKRQLHTFNTL